MQDGASRIKRHPDRRLYLHEWRHDELHRVDVHMQKCWPWLRQPVLHSSFELVCVNLDGSAEEAAAAIKRASAVGLHLHQAGGTESKLATDYGIMGPHLFLVGKDSKVVSRNMSLSGLEDELKKQLK